MDYDAVYKRIHVLEVERNRTSRPVLREEWLDFQTVSKNCSNVSIL